MSSNATAVSGTQPASFAYLGALSSTGVSSPGEVRSPRTVFGALLADAALIDDDTPQHLLAQMTA